MQKDKRTNWWHFEPPIPPGHRVVLQAHVHLAALSIH